MKYLTKIKLINNKKKSNQKTLGFIISLDENIKELKSYENIMSRVRITNKA